MSMHQSLTYYDALLAHDHPVFTGILRISFERAKLQMDRQILRLYTVTIVFVPVAMLTGIFSENVRVPRDGNEFHKDENGDPAGFTWYVDVAASRAELAGSASPSSPRSRAFSSSARSSSPSRVAVVSISHARAMSSIRPDRSMPMLLVLRVQCPLLIASTICTAS